MHKTQSPSTSTKKKKNKKKNKNKKKKQKQKIMYFNTLFFFWMSLLDALDFTIQDVSNPKKRGINNQSKRVIWLFSLLV
jgi:hypothetical protein